MPVKRKLFVEETPSKKKSAKRTLTRKSSTPEVKRAFEQLLPEGPNDGSVFRGTGVRLFQILRGDTQNARIGSSVTSRGLRVQWSAKNTGGISQTFRILVLRAKSLGYQATVANVYNNLLTTLGNNQTLAVDSLSLDDPDRMNYPVDKDRWEVISNKMITLGKNNNEGNTPPYKHGNYYVKFTPKKIRYYEPVPSPTTPNPFPDATEMSEAYVVLAYSAYDDFTVPVFSNLDFNVKLNQYYTDN